MREKKAVTSFLPTSFSRDKRKTLFLIAPERCSILIINISGNPVIKPSLRMSVNKKNIYTSFALMTKCSTI